MLHEKDLLWEELNLEGLLDSMKVSNNNFADEIQKDSKPKSDALIGHQKMLNKPAYSVLIDRYKSLPHKPKTIHIKKLERLADPVKGRYSHFDKYVDEYPSAKHNGIGVSNNSSPQWESPHKTNGENRTQSAFFLTGGEDDEDDNYNHGSSLREKAEHYGNNISSMSNNRNGFAAVLRSRVEAANRIEQSQIPLKHESSVQTSNFQKNSKSKPVTNRRPAGNGDGKLIHKKAVTSNKPVKALSTRKKAWHENTAIHHFKGSTNKKPLSQMVADPRKGRQADDRRREASLSPSKYQTSGGRKIISSGYGNGNVVSSNGKAAVPRKLARERIINKILVEPADQPPVDVPAPATVRQLRSKSTIDILETIEETEESLEKKRTSKSGTRSAPLGRDRSRDRDTRNTGKTGARKVQKQGAKGSGDTSLSPRGKKGMPLTNFTSAKGAHPNSYLAAHSSRSTNEPTSAQNAVTTSAAPYDYSQFNRLISGGFATNKKAVKSDGQHSPVRQEVSKNGLSSVKGTNDHESEDPVKQSEREYADIQSTIARLKMYEASLDTAIRDSGPDGGKAEISTLTKKATKLGNHFSNADAIMNKYKNLANEFS